MKRLLIVGISFILLSSPVALGYGLLSTLSFGGSAEMDSIPNDAPTISNPNPSNNSIDQELSLTWNVTIQDPDGDTFNWTIECSNGQSNSANGASNGSKTLSLSGLSYNTQYTVWVNATDGTDSASSIYYFTTKDETATPTYALLETLSFGGSAEIDTLSGTSYGLLSTLSFGGSAEILENSCPASSGFSIVNGTVNVSIIPHP